MKRRTFLFTTACIAAPQTALEFSELPNFCSHENWGNIDSIGRVSQGFRADAEAGARPTRRTGFMDLLLEPYFRGWLTAGGTDLTTLSVSGWEAFTLLRPALEVPYRSIQLFNRVRFGYPGTAPGNPQFGVISGEYKMHGCCSSRYDCCFRCVCLFVRFSAPRCSVSRRRAPNYGLFTLPASIFFIAIRPPLRNTCWKPWEAE